jgi:serine protease Do
MMSSLVSLSKAKLAVLVAGFLLVFPAAAQPPAEAPQAPPPPPPLFAFNGTDEKVLFKYAGGGGSYLGVDVTEIGTERARALKLTEERGVELTRVAEGSPAAKAGLKAGDVVLEFNGQRVEGTEQFVRLIRETPVGRVVKLLISRGGSSQTFEAAIGKRPEMKWSRTDVEREIERARMEANKFRVEIPDMPRALMSWRTPVLGIEGESLEGQLAGYFGVESGVLVRSVLKGTPADKALLKAGDVILKVDDTKVNTPREISSAVRALNAKKTFPLLVRRNHKDLTLSVTVEDTGGERRFAPRRRVVVHEEP